MKGEKLNRYTSTSTQLMHNAVVLNVVALIKIVFLKLLHLSHISFKYTQISNMILKMFERK